MSRVQPVQLAARIERARPQRPTCAGTSTLAPGRDMYVRRLFYFPSFAMPTTRPDQRIEPAPAAGAAEAVRLTGRPATAVLMHYMNAARLGQGVNSARLLADAVAAHRGDVAARRRLFRVMRPAMVRRPRSCVPTRRVAVGKSRPRRRNAGTLVRARSPGRPELDRLGPARRRLSDQRPLDLECALGGLARGRGSSRRSACARRLG
jgi:hypothetical protein